MWWRCWREAPIRTTCRTRDGATLRPSAALIRREEMVSFGGPIASPFPWRTQTPLACFGEIDMKKFSLCATATCFFVAIASTAHARSAYDGSWDLAFVTQRGACDPVYNFTVNISNGVVTHPNLVRFRGYVARSGAVRASVTVQDKYASGSGRLSGTSGRGTWSGYAGNARCSGYWTAQRN
jgi:hypothetical protein